MCPEDRLSVDFMNAMSRVRARSSLSASSKPLLEGLTTGIRSLGGVGAVQENEGLSKDVARSRRT